MGGGNSCPECPKCEQKECPTCDNSWSMVDDIKRIPVSGTPFTVLKMELTDVQFPNDIERVEDAFRDISTSFVFIVSPDTDYTKSDKIAVITLQAPYKPKARYVYGERASYEKLKKASEVLNKVLKEYANWYMFSMNQSIDSGSYSSIINGGELAKRYNEYRPLLTNDEISNMQTIQTLLGANMTVNDDAVFSLKDVSSVNDLDLKIVALLWRDSDPSEKLMFMPEQNTENFCASSNNCSCLLTAIVVLILIGIGLYVLFCRGDRSVSRANVSEQPVFVNE